MTMMKNKPPVSVKQKKINQIMSLLTGELKPADVGPRMLINFNTPAGDVYLINGDRVDKVTFDNRLKQLPPMYERFNVTGRPGDDGPTPDEYYC